MIDNRVRYPTEFENLETKVSGFNTNLNENIEQPMFDAHFVPPRPFPAVCDRAIAITFSGKTFSNPKAAIRGVLCKKLFLEISQNS